MRIFSASGISRYSITWRRIIHRPLIAASKMLMKHKVKLLRDSYEQNIKPTIYAITHVFNDDIAAALSCLQDNAFVLISNKEGNMKSKNGVALLLNGVIWIDRSDKKSRTAALEKMTAILRLKGNVLIDPEGNWNLSPNLPVLKLWWGLLDAAACSGAYIVPVTIDLVDDNYCVIIGEKFDYAKHSDKANTIDALRDVMSTMVWELLEMKPQQKRSEIAEEHWVSHAKTELARAPFLDQTTEESFTYRPKGEVSLGELLADMHGIEYKSMAADYEQHKRVQSLIDNWTKPVRFL